MMKTEQRNDLAIALEEYLLERIPISSAMGKIGGEAALIGSF